LVLRTGGHLMIEVPDPQWPLARLFGRYWMPWFQPQHQHMMPLANLTAALAERGLRTVAVERGATHQACDFAMAAALFIMRLAGNPASPWGPRMLRAAASAPSGLTPAASAPTASAPTAFAPRPLPLALPLVGRVRQVLVWTLGMPFIAVGLLIDRTIVRAAARRLDSANAYRVVAVRTEEADDDRG